MLTFRRVATGCYVADDETNRYIVTEEHRAWTLDVRHLATTAGVRHAVGQPIQVTSGGHNRKYVAVAVANAYSDLGDGYRAHEHGYRNRMTSAVIRAYDETS